MTPERQKELRTFKDTQWMETQARDAIAECLGEIESLKKEVEDLKQRLGHSHAMESVAEQQVGCASREIERLKALLEAK